MIIKFDRSQIIVTEILELVEQYDLDYIDAVLHYVETHNLEIEQVAAIISENDLLKSKIEEQAENLNFLKKKARLPI